MVVQIRECPLHLRGLAHNEGESLQSCLTLCDPWTVPPQAPLSMEFSRQEDWSGLPCPSSRDLPNSVIKPRPPTLQADSLWSEPNRCSIKRELLLMASESNGRRPQNAYFLTSFKFHQTPFLSLGICVLTLLTVCCVLLK